MFIAEVIFRKSFNFRCQPQVYGSAVFQRFWCKICAIRCSRSFLLQLLVRQRGRVLGSLSASQPHLQPHSGDHRIHLECKIILKISHPFLPLWLIKHSTASIIFGKYCFSTFYLKIFQWLPPFLWNKGQNPYSLL